LRIGAFLPPTVAKLSMLKNSAVFVYFVLGVYSTGWANEKRATLLLSISSQVIE